MQYRKYVARCRAKFKGICGEVNIPWGTALESKEGYILWAGQRLCLATSQNAYDYFSQDDDGCGQERGGLVSAILAQTEKRDAGYQGRWNAVWSDPLCQKYRRAEHADFWLWGQNFFNAPISDLKHIAALVGAKPAGRWS